MAEEAETTPQQAWKNPMAWLPHSIAEAALSTGDGEVPDLAAAWAHLQERLSAAEQLVRSTPVNKNRLDYGSGMRHLMVLLTVGTDMALRADPDPVLAVNRASMDDIVTWGLECPDCVYLNASLRAGETYRLFGNRGTARYVGLQTMDGIAATFNCLVDDLEVGADGSFEAILSADEHDGNWLRLTGDHPTLTVRNFLYDWDTEVPASLRIERIGDEVAPAARSVELDVSVSRQLHALGDFVYDNLKFFLDFGAMPPANGFIPPMDMTEMGAAAENRPVIGRFELDPDEALILEVRAARGRLLEHLAGQSVVGDDSLRTPSVQSQRTSGGHRSRRDLPRRHCPRPIREWRTGWTPRVTATAQCYCAVCEPKPRRYQTRVS